MPDFTTFPSPTLNNVTSNTVTLSGDATLPLQAVPLQQVTAITGGPYLLLGGGVLTGPMALAGNAASALQPVTLQQLNAATGGNGPFLPLAGNATVTGPLRLTGLPQAQSDGSPPIGAVTGDLYINGGVLCVTP